MVSYVNLLVLSLIEVNTSWREPRVTNHRHQSLTKADSHMYFVSICIGQTLWPHTMKLTTTSFQLMDGVQKEHRQKNIVNPLQHS